jgi:hypothetical protein
MIIHLLSQIPIWQHCLSIMTMRPIVMISYKHDNIMDLGHLTRNCNKNSHRICALQFLRSNAICKSQNNIRQKYNIIIRSILSEIASTIFANKLSKVSKKI